MIALQLGISPRTVEVYRANIMDKLDCENLASLLKIVFRAGLFDSPHDGFRRPAMPAERIPASGSRPLLIVAMIAEQRLKPDGEPVNKWLRLSDRSLRTDSIQFVPIPHPSQA